MSPQLAAWLGGAAAAIAIVTGVWKVLRKLGRGWRRISEFLEDWRGEEARPGFPRRPGVPERLEATEQAVTANTERLAAIEDRIGRVEYEMQPNGGSSFRDEVRRAITDDGQET